MKNHNNQKSEVVEYCEKENLYGLKLEKILSFTNIDF